MPNKLVIAEIQTTSESYDKLTHKFAEIEKLLPEEARTTLDGLLSEISKEWDEVPQMVVRIVNDVVNKLCWNERVAIARQVCPLCDQGLKLTDLNGRFVHHELGKNDEPRRCVANKIWILPMPNIQIKVEKQ